MFFSFLLGFNNLISTKSARDVAAGIIYLHDKEVIHRDIALRK